MGCCSSSRRRSRRDNGDESAANLVGNDGGDEVNAVGETDGQELDLIASPSVICRLSPCLFMSALWRWPSYAFNIWDDWVFAKLVGRDGKHRFYAFNIQANLSLPFPYLKDGPVEGSAITVAGRELYVIGGALRSGVVSNCGYVCDLVNLKGWRRIASMRAPRRNAVAITRDDGWLFVFGGCQDSTAPLAELFDPRIQQWTSLLVDGHHPGRGFDPPFEFVVVNSIAFIRNAAGGIVFSNTNVGWTHQVVEGTRAHQELFRHWSLDCNAAAAGPDSHFLITCYVEMIRRSSTGTDIQEVEEAVYSVRAYNPATHSWFTIRGLPQIIQENAQKCQFMSFDHGGTCIGIMLAERGLTLLTFDLKYGTPDANGDITYMEACAYSRRPRPLIKKKWLLQTPHGCPPPPRGTGRYCWLMRPRRNRMT